MPLAPMPPRTSALSMAHAMSKPTQYLVVLSPSSEIGKAFLKSNTHDFMWLDAPCLMCTSLEHPEVTSLRLVHPLPTIKGRKQQQRLLIRD
jgi:hypothetical protein